MIMTEREAHEIEHICLSIAFLYIHVLFSTLERQANEKKK